MRTFGAKVSTTLMKIHLISAYEVHPGLDTVLSSAMLDTVKSLSLCESPEIADVIVFVENTQFDDLLFKRLLDHELVKKYPNKVFMYNEMDRPWEVLPGLYTCMSKKHFDITRQRAFAYLSTPNPLVRNIYKENAERRWLYSFMGAMSHACRRQIMRLPTSNAFLKDTSEFNVWNASDETKEQRAKEYIDVLGGSHFVLCPRGIGTSSIRLYETLEAGRVPVIIADHWVPPEETDWSFAIQVKENNISSLPGLLKALEAEAGERGEAARKAWLQSYAPDTLFSTLGNAIAEIHHQNSETGSFMSARNKRIEWNKWLASSGLYARTAVQRLRGQR